MRALQPQLAGPLVHHRDEPFVIASDVPGDRFAGIVCTRHEHRREQIAQEKLFSGSEVVGRMMHDCAAVDLDYFLERRRIQRDERSHDFRQAGGRKAARRILCDENPA